MTDFINARAVLSDTATDIYTCPAGKTAIVIGAQVTNRSGTNDEVLEFWWTDASNSDVVTYLADGTFIPVNASYEPIGGKLVLSSGDKLRGLGGTANELEATVSVLEL
jgi:hypothetical protein